MKKLFLFLIAVSIFGNIISAETIKETYLVAIKGSDTLYLDRVYDPTKMADAPAPTMIYMYGGGFAFGNRGGNFKYLTDIGVQVISVDYRKLLTATGYAPVAPEVKEHAQNTAIEDLTDAIAYTLSHAKELNVDVTKVMFSGSSAGAICTMMALYDICNEGPHSKKYPSGFMPAGYIAYAGAIRNREAELTWKHKPCPMMFFHGTADTSLPVDTLFKDGISTFGPLYIVEQLKEMGVPYWLYIEEGADHVLSYKPFSGYNTNEIQTFIKKFVLQGLPLQMETREKNLVEASHLPN